MASAETEWFNAGSNPSVQTKCETMLVRNGTTVTVYWTVRMKLPSSASYLGTGSLNVASSCSGGGSDWGTIKEHNTIWNTTAEHSYSGSYTFENSSTSTQTFTVYFSSSSDYFSSSGIFSTSVQCSVDGYAAYATISANVDSKGLDFVKINWSTDVNVDQFQYRLNSGSWIDAEKNIDKRSGSFTITGLTPNTFYKISFDAKRKDSQQWSTHGGKGTSVNETTYDIGKISTLGNFNHGDNISVTTTNPSGESLNLTMTINNTQIFSKSVSTGSNVISMTDEELDNIYKLYSSSNSLTATFTLVTNSNYTDTKNVTVTLTGNQKTAHVIGGRAKVYVGVNGSIKKAVVWVGNNGRKRCI